MVTLNIIHAAAKLGLACSLIPSSAAITPIVAFEKIFFSVEHYIDSIYLYLCHLVLCIYDHLIDS